MSAREFVTMSVAGQHFGVPVLRVRDVLDTPVIYAVPLAPPEICGSINLRGRIVTAVDLRTRLGLARRPPSARCMCVIVEAAAGEPYALLVDEIGDVMSMSAADFEPNPITLSKEWSAVCTGLYRQTGKLLVVLDIDALLNLERRAAA